MVKATITHKPTFGRNILGALALAFLAVFLVVSCTGCGLLSGFRDGNGYSSNDVTMESWGNIPWSWGR